MATGFLKFNPSIVLSTIWSTTGISNCVWSWPIAIKGSEYFWSKVGWARFKTLKIAINLLAANVPIYDTLKSNEFGYKGSVTVLVDLLMFFQSFQEELKLERLHSICTRRKWWLSNSYAKNSTTSTEEFGEICLLRCDNLLLWTLGPRCTKVAIFININVQFERSILRIACNHSIKLSRSTSWVADFFRCLSASTV